MAIKNKNNKNKDITPKRIMQGKVVSDKMNKTIVVAIENTYMHPFYKKVMRSIKNYKTHDEAEQAKIGDIVEIYEGKPVSKTKYMYLKHIMSSAK